MAVPSRTVEPLLKVHFSRRVGHWLIAALLTTLFLAGTADVARLYRTIGIVQAELKHAQSDNATWQIAQGEVDLLRYRLAVLEAMESDSDLALSEARRAYDILYSRIAVIDSTFQKSTALRVTELEDQWAKIRAALLQQVAIIDQPDDELRAAFPRLAASNVDATHLTRNFTVDALQAIVNAAMQQREELQWLMKRAFVSGSLMYFLLVASALVLKFTLTQSKKQAIDLARLNSKLNKVINASADAIFVSDSAGHIGDCNSAALAKFGISHFDVPNLKLEELITVDLEGILPSVTLPWTTFPKSPPDKAFEGVPFQVVAKRVNGTKFPAEVTSIADRGADGDLLYIVYVRDISEVLEARAALVSSRDLALMGERSKSRFIAVMNHEMRTPLNGLIAALDILQTTTRITKRQSQFLAIARQCSNAALEQIDDVLEMARLDDQAQVEDVEMFDIIDILEGLVAQNKLLAEQRRNRLVSQLPDLPVTLVIGHRRLLGRVIYNLLGNAIKFTEHGLIKLRLAVTHEVDNTISACFSVEDTGVGIPTNRLGDIFRDFETVDKSYARRAEGTGLGLGIAKRAVEKMGGTLCVASQEGKGSTFWFRVHLQLAHNPLLTAPGNGTQHCRGSESRPSTRIERVQEVLIAEDNVVNRLVLREMLQHIGCHVDEARTGIEAVQLSSKKIYDLIIMDLRMPELDGIEATRLICASDSQRRTYIVGLTAHAEADDYARMLEAGMESVLFKPVTISSLEALLAKTVKKKNREAPKLPARSEHFLLDAATCRELQQLMPRSEFSTIIRRFIDDTDQTLGNIEPSTDLGQCALDLHKITGSSSYFGATALRTLVLACEENARRGNLEVVVELLAAINNCWTETRTALAALASSELSRDSLLHHPHR